MGWDDVAKGVATGGLSTFIEGGFGGNGYDTTRQVPMETPEQRAARQLLLKYATSGQIGDITAGQDLQLGQGNYNLSGLEQSGLSRLNSMIAGGQPEMYGVANQGIRDLMNTSTAGLDAQFSPFKAIAEREGQTAMDAAKRGAAFSGNLYSTDTVRKLGDVAARTNESKMAELSRLTEGALNRKVQATGLAQQAGSLEESTNRGRTQDAFTYGGLERTLQNQQVEAANAEKLRRRQEIMGQLDAAGSVSGASVPFGVPEIKTPKPNPYMDFLQLVVSGGSKLAGAR